MKEEIKTFDLGKILNITTGNLFTNMDDVFEVMKFLFGRGCYIHELPKMRQIAQDYILSYYPELENVGKGVDPQSREEFLNEQRKVYGNEFHLKPMSIENKVSASNSRR